MSLKRIFGLSRNFSYFIIMFTASLFSCNSDGGFKTTESGIKYKYITQGEGPEPKNGEILKLHLSYQDENNKELFTTTSEAGPVPIVYDSSFSKNGSLEEIFSMIREGDSLEFQIPAKVVFEKTFRTQIPDSISAEGNLTFQLKLIEVVSVDDYLAEQYENFYQQRKESLESSADQMTEDINTIEGYLDEQDLQADTTKLGSRFIILEEGEGAYPSKGDQVRISYSGRVLNGPFFDSSIKEIAEEHGFYDESREPYGPIEFTLGRGEVIFGWDEGIEHLREGEKARLFIPSPLAYGPQEVNDVIKANSILVFDVELVEIIEQ